MSTEDPAARIVRCPACGGPSRYALDNPHRHFCSARCRQHDFGAWATEDYRIATRPAADDAGDDAGVLDTPPR